MLGLALFGLASCILDSGDTAKRGSEVENELHGILVALDGKPVQGARVKAVPAMRMTPKLGAAAPDSDSVVTDADGRYAFKGLEAGRYNLFGDYESGNLVVLIPDVERLDTTQDQDLGTDTLRAPGRIRGRLLLGDHGKAGVLAYVPGTSYLAVSDDSGRFVITGVPQGIHAVRYSAAGFLIEPDTGVMVLSGKTTDLPVKRLVHDPALPPPAPTGLKAVYDTLHERVTLTWDTVPVSDLEGYVIYRDRPAFLDPVVVEDGFITGTTFVDSAFPKPVGTEKIPLVYRIKSRDKELNYSLSFSSPAPVEVVSSGWVTTRIETSMPPMRDGAVSVEDTLLLSIAYGNPTRRITEVSWHAAGRTEPLRTRKDSALKGADSLLWIAADRPGPVTLEARVTDDAGRVAKAVFEIHVVQDPPKALAGPDTVASPGDTIRLRGMGTDIHGWITDMRWSCGDAGELLDSGEGTASLVLPAGGPRVLECVLRVTDDDGNTAHDTLQVALVGDPPQADAGRDFAVSIGDSVHLQGSGSDGFGSVAKWEWDIGGQGAFATSPDGKVSFRAATEPSSVACILRVTDDDGNQSLDTVRVLILEDLPVADAGSPRSATINDRITLTGSGRDGLGRIVQLEWDVGGTGAFEPRPDGMVEVRLPSVPRPDFPAILRVTDDDGKQALDTVRIAVLLDPPVAVATADSGEYFEEDSVRLQAHGSRDGLGTLVKVEWKVGDAAAFTPAGMDTSIVVPAGMNPVRCILRVTDDDALVSMDTVEIKTHPRGFKAWIRSTNRLPSLVDGMTCNALVFKDRMWLIGRVGENGSSYHSMDGKTWTLGASKAFDAIPGNSAVVFKDRIWVFSARTFPDTTSGRIWSSGDGISWVQNAVTPAYGRRSIMAMTVFKDRIWLFGGREPATGSNFKDIWSSGDGLNWVKSDATLPFAPNSDDSPIVVHDGRIFIFEKFTSKVWSSVDGETWTQGTNTAPDVLGYRSPVAYEGRIWGFGGGWDSVYPPVAFTSDGLTWSTILSDPTFPPRAAAMALAFRGRIWVIGGANPAWSTDFIEHRDVWYSK